MRIQFSSAVPIGNDAYMEAAHLDYTVNRPESIIGQFNGGKDSKSIPVDGLTLSDRAIYAQYWEMVARNFKGEFEAGTVTARSKDFNQPITEEPA